MTDRLHLDFETRSEAPLDEVGLYNYVTHPSTEVLMLAWSLNDRSVQLWEPHAHPEMPAELAEGLEDPFVEKFAWNATFERSIFKHVLKTDIPTPEWIDPSIYARYISLPGSLEDAGEVLQIGDEVAKMQEGKDLIKLFCEPVETGGGAGLFGRIPTTWNNWKTHPDNWARFGQYCRQDVLAEKTITKRIERWAPPASERRNWELDQRINERGMPADMALVAGATKVVAIERARLERRQLELTGLQNPNSVPQLLPWVRERGYPFNAMGKAFVTRALKGEGDLTPECREALLIRQQASKSSVHKLDSLRKHAAADGRLRHQFVFMGAGATGRFSGTGPQIQNLPRPTKEVEKKMDRAVALLRAADHATIAQEFSSVLEVAISCLRPMFRAPKGKKLIVADLNAIENRMLAWLSRSPSMLSVYAEGRCPYIDFATELYGQSYEELWHEYKVEGNGAKRTMAKPGVLGCGYGLSGGEQITDENGDAVKTGLLGYADAMGVTMTQEEAQRAVDLFRTKYSEVKQYWKDLEYLSMVAVRNPGHRYPVGQVTFLCTGKSMLRILLPSGRALHYLFPEIVEKEITFIDKRSGNPKTIVKDTLTFAGKDQETRQWVRKSTYGGHLTENLCQAISRDILLEGMQRAEAAGFEVVGHVHDEIITLVDEDSPLTHKDLEIAMATVPEWAAAGEVRVTHDGEQWVGDPTIDSVDHVVVVWNALPLGAEGYEDDHYRKG